MNKAIFLDRDGIINKAIIVHNKPYSPKNLNEVKIISGIGDLLKYFKKEGYYTIVVSNQPEVARGSITEDTVVSINNYLKKKLPIDDFFMCYHDDGYNCGCRKPEIGLFLQAQNKYNISFIKSFMIGDRWRDMEAGYKILCTNIFVDYNYDEKKSDKWHYKVNDVRDIRRIFK